MAIEMREKGRKGKGLSRQPSQRLSPSTLRIWTDISNGALNTQLDPRQFSRVGTTARVLFYTTRTKNLTVNLYSDKIQVYKTYRTILFDGNSRMNFKAQEFQ
uniref:Uncharacterized protein n=1 Tax=Vespula pensylvanica TaxID=30213 RepID=A0A834PDA3_VESPE|nr:hypothetical protein H0235_004149 [Vespula pensylvanica]